MKDKFRLIQFANVIDFPSNLDSNIDNSVIIGFDIDWASDFVLEDSLNLANQYGVNPTLFITHDSPYIRKIFEEAKNEFGLHPNFERLLDGSDANGTNSQLVLSRLIEKFPNLKIVRSHCLTTSSRLKVLFKKTGFMIESSFISHGTNEEFPKIWRDFSGLIQVPITWEDDVWFTLNQNYDDPLTSKVLRPGTLNVLTFHPIHIYLNTLSEAHYLKAKDFANDSKSLIYHRAEGKAGVRSIFKDICGLVNG